ncbi:MAG TPA: type II toxin-antitoxin system Phd/YefM family antitoxin [Candidatus Choladousia intestinigallinarum]|nr:type II toxin-antitoxin system Phd/YefM family antitoxin [Candidatus Choladousia intestinigallinarum]
MPQIIPIKDLKNTSEISEMCHRTNEPIYITKNGYGDMVIMSMESFEYTMKQIKMYEDIEISERQIKEGRVKDARRSLSSMREQYGL